MPQVLKELGLAFYKGHERKGIFEMSASTDGKGYLPLIARTSSAGKTAAIQRFDFDDTVARYIKITAYGNDKITAFGEFRSVGVEDHGAL